MQRKLFCEINPVCYRISVQKEITKRNLKDFFCQHQNRRNQKRNNIAEYR